MASSYPDSASVSRRWPWNSDRLWLGLEIAEAVAVEPALTETQAAPQHLFEHFSLEGTDCGVDLGKLVVRAGVLAENRDCPARVNGDFGLDPAVVEHSG